MGVRQAFGRGFRGHPIHPPLTDVVVGAFTVAVVAVVVGWVGFLEARMVDVAFLASVVGLVAALPTATTGFVDYLRMPRGSSLRRTTTLHWVAMVLSVAVFTAGAALLQPGDAGGRMPILGGAVVVGGWVVLLFGSWVGGGIVFHHGMRVLGDAEVSTREAIRPKLPPD